MDNLPIQNCEACTFSKMPHADNEHCYMFKDKPQGRCAKFDGQRLHNMIPFFIPNGTIGIAKKFLEPFKRFLD